MEVMKIRATSFKRSHACTAALSAPNPAAGHHQPMPLLETPGYSRASLGQSLVGSLLLSPGSWCIQGSVCALQESVSLVLCEFWRFYGGVHGNLLHDSLCHTQVCCTQSPCSRRLLTCTSTEDTQTQFWLSLCGLGVCFVPFPGLSSSGDQVLSECTVPGGPCVLITSPSWPLGFLAVHHLRCAVCLLWRDDLKLRPMASVNHLGVQEDGVSSWKPAHSLVEDAVSEAEIAAASCLPAPVVVTCLPLCLGRGPICSQLSLLWYSLSPFSLSCQAMC